MSRPTVPGAVILALALMASLTVACKDQGPELAYGAAQVSIATTGADLDPDGYTVSVDSGPAEPVAINGTITLSALTAGDHSVVLNGVAANCAVNGDSLRMVRVSAATTERVDFAITCVRMTGDLQVTIATTGADLDSDGYAVRVDSSPAQPVAINGAIILSALTASEHVLALGGVAANCSVSGDSLRTVRVSAGATARVDFAITCVQITGALQVSVATTGTDLDPDGYSLRVDSGPAHAVATNGTMTLTGLTAGDHAVVLRGVAGNCTLNGDSLRTVHVSAAATELVGFAVTCVQVEGDLMVTVSTTGADLDPNGYSLSVDGGQPQRVASNASSTLSALEAGVHTLLLADVAPNCWISENANPLSVAFTPPTGTAWFDVVCLTIASGSVIAFEHMYSNYFDNSYGPIGVADKAGHVVVLASGVGRPTWSPDGTRIAFERQYHIFVINHDGTGLADLTPTLGGLWPAWSPDGSKIAFVSVGGVQLMNPDGSGVVPIPNTSIPGARQPYGRLAWSPDGNRIAFTCLLSGATGNGIGICSINVDGTGFGLLTSSAGGDSDPAWSPDGTRIAFTRVGVTPGSWAVTIFLMNADGSGVTPLAYGSAPAWSPDGTRIAVNAVICDDPNNPDYCHGAIQLFGAEGSDLGLFTRDGYDPAWKP